MSTRFKPSAVGWPDHIRVTPLTQVAHWMTGNTDDSHTGLALLRVGHRRRSAQGDGPAMVHLADILSGGVDVARIVRSVRMYIM